MRLADFPNMKKDARTKWHREIYRMAYPAVESKAISTDELAVKLRAVLGG